MRLRIFLDTFEGPLDLLLYLIRKHNLDVLDIPMSSLTRQYMDYVEAMRTNQLETGAEYLLMAALLRESNRECCCRGQHRAGHRRTIRARNWCAAARV
jgi:chromatin segregation and condensation protein Rec8/ScpA/Scc1 (kleisin family)